MQSSTRIAIAAVPRTIARIQTSTNLIRPIHHLHATSSPRTALRQRGSFRNTLASQRCYSTPTSEWPLYDYAQVKKISESPSSERIIIDVREPAEYEAGYIPTAINLPIRSQPDAIFLPEAEFEDRFGFAKPPVDAEVVFYCKAGVRSTAAATLAKQHGYKNVSEYRGSWKDWESNGGKTEKP